MSKQLQQAILLRENGNPIDSNEILILLAKESPEDGYTQYQCAWSFDAMGKEREAVPYYENAIRLGLPDGDLKGAILGLGSTYRALGEYEKSKEIFSKGLELFPENHAIKVFLSMTLYNLGEHSKAMELMLNSLIDTTADEEVLRYKKAIHFYSNKLDETWE